MMNRYAQSLKDVLKTPVKDASVVSFHGETRCLTREARAIIRFVHGLKILDASELAGVFDSNKRAVERVVGNQYHGSKMDADDVREDRGWIHPVLLGLLEEWARKTKKQLKKDRKKTAESAVSSASESQESISGSEKRSKQEKGVESKPVSSAHVVEELQVPRITRRGRKAPLPSPPASTVEPSPAPEKKIKRKRRQPASSVSVEAEVEADDEPSQPPKPKRARRSPTSASASPSTATDPTPQSDSDFHRLQSFFHDLKYVPADLKRLNELGLGPAELLLTRSFEKEEAEVYFGDILKTYSKPIVVRAMAHVVYSAAERHWKVLE